ncbi:DNA helicase [Rhodovibrio sodomensis]|uniref:DNA 3'-5' helicase n=1 Tax=Rhodovibrio sodomensis TaxID=1088 RepID=A0ABS1DGR0_9PROT|nr:UvrD-helicase domain-containing protein [Rhodovibrio sodomensis]MBK1669287.1 DNA helicase [Rhodovibrio sodomensis]
MQFRIAKSFQDSLSRLQAAEQKQAKMTAYDLQAEPERPGLNLHPVKASKDRRFHTVRVNDDIRIVVHKTDDSMMLCYVDHHDDAYAWAERRRIEAHPKTGAAQIVEVVERQTEEAAPAVPHVGEEAHPAQTGGRRLFDGLDAERLLGVGVPESWVPAVQAADESSFFDLIDHLPEEASEALLTYAETGKLETSAEAQPEGEGATDPFEHPDAQRRFRVLEDAGALRHALEFPWEKWTVFLHPAQQEVVDRRFGGPARVSGSAGTGKTVVALHRAVRLAERSQDGRVLLATFSKPLAHALRLKLRRLVDAESETARRITVGYVDGIGHQLYELAFARKPNIASRSQIEAALNRAVEETGETRFSQRFLLNEWRSVVDAWQLRDWEAYRDVSRLGRKTRIGGRQREALWQVFARTQEILRQRNVVTWAEAVAQAEAHYREKSRKPFDHAVIDEAQDISIPQLRFMAAIVPDGPDNLFFAGDLGQRIFQQPYSWLSQGVDVRGRSVSLRVNYRTSYQIKRKADQLLPMKVRDVDGYEESRKGTVSVFDGPEPEIGLFDSTADENAYVADWIRQAVDAGAAPEEIGVFVRTRDELDRARAAVKAAGQEALTLSERVEDVAGKVVIGTMHLAKGQEFKAVAVMACDDEVLPLQSRIESAAEEAELEEIFETERHLLYVAVTRARDRVLVSGLEPGSEFVADLST